MQEESDVEIKRASEEDIKGINKLMQVLLGDPIKDRKAYFARAMVSDNYSALIAVKVNEIVGFLDMWSFPDVGHGADLGIIMNFIVAEKFRNKGIGSNLLQEAIKLADERELHELHVWTDFKNEAAIKTYKNLGFINECLLLEREFSQ